MATPKRPPFAPMTKPGATSEARAAKGVSTDEARDAGPDPAPAAKTKSSDGRVTTTLRIDPKMLADLKVIAARRGVKLNDLLLDGATYVHVLNKEHLKG